MLDLAFAMAPPPEAGKKEGTTAPTTTQQAPITPTGVGKI